MLIEGQASLDLTNSFTIEFWVKPDSSLQYSHILNKHQPGINDDGSWVVKYSNPNKRGEKSISFAWPNKPYSTFSVVIDRGDNQEWFHCAVCYNAENHDLS